MKKARITTLRRFYFFALKKAVMLLLENAVPFQDTNPTKNVLHGNVSAYSARRARLMDPDEIYCITAENSHWYFFTYMNIYLSSRWGCFK